MFTRKSLYKAACLLATTFCGFIQSHSQCTRVAPAARTCPISSGTAIIADGVTNNNINSTVFYYNGSGGTAKISMTNNGVLDVCGNLTVTASSTFNLSSGGTIQVESGGSLTINCGITLNNTGQIVNRGTLIINGNVSATNVNATIWNLSSVGFTVGTSYTVKMQSGSYFIDSAYSNATIASLNLSGGYLCLGNNSIVNTQNFTNSLANSVVYSGTLLPGCLGVSSTATLNNLSVTSSSNINVCLATGEATNTGGASGNWGFALVSSNCAGCNIILPIKNTQLSGNFQHNRVNLSWSQNGSMSPDDFFNVEESNNGTDFHSIATIVANMNKSEYAFSDYDIITGVQYYRIKQTNGYGNVFYSNIIAIKNVENSSLAIYPNPVLDRVNIRISSDIQEEMKLSIADISGRVSDSKQIHLTTGINKLSWDIKQLPSGTYVIKLQSPFRGIITRLISVMHP